jgi:hypothetical protein
MPNELEERAKIVAKWQATLSTQTQADFLTEYRVSAEEIRALLAFTQEAGWMPIEQAPRDGSDILVINDRGQFVACFDPEWSDGWWMVSDGKDIERPLRGDEPHGWRPLPAPPQA